MRQLDPRDIRLHGMLRRTSRIQPQGKGHRPLLLHARGGRHAPSSVVGQ